MKRIGFIVVVILALGVPGAAVIPAAQAGTGAARIVGKVVNEKAAGVKGAKVTVEGQSVMATTAADGSFKLVGVKPGSVYLYVSAPSNAYLDGETLKSISVKSGATVSGVVVTLSGRPGAAATYVGMKTCAACHDGKAFKSLDGTPHAAAHSRFVTEGTSHLVYKSKWPEPGDKYLPRDPKGKLLKVQDPLDGEGMVNAALCTKGDGSNRQYLFKFYPEQKEGVSLTDADLDCSDKPADAVWIPVAATIGGEGKWGEGYTDPDHKVADRSPNFDEGKQRYMCKIEDVPYIVKWMKENNVSREGQKQDYVAFMPVFMMQYGTPEGSKVLAKGQVGAPMFWQKSPASWCDPYNTLSRNCAGCHATGLQLKTQDFLGDPNPKHKYKSVVTYWDYKDLNITCERCHGPGSEHAAAGDKTKIIVPRHLTAKAGNEACGQCHGSHDAKNQRPLGIYKPPYDANYKDTLGHGFFVPGVYNLETFHVNFDKPSIKPNTLEGDWEAGSFMAWPDQTHGRAHSMELSELRRSAHLNNTREKLTCYTCHEAHSLDAGPASLKVGGYEFASPAYGNNTLCLACHATRGQFKNVTMSDVAVLQLDAGRKVTKAGDAFPVQPAEVFVSRDRVARAVARHMQVGAGMGGALYTPDNPSMPVGSCTSCHMAKIGKLTDLNVDAMYRLDFDKDGKSAVAEGGTSSHVFDIVWPGQSSILKNPDPSKGHDYDIMPNSCGKCHAFARTSGDNH
jgi:Carboxypeptidase regulatory-like domain